jgi:hypothetical protein
MALFLYNLLKQDMDTAAEWGAKAIDQRDPNTIGIPLNRQELQTSGHWPALARMLNLPEGQAGVAT